MKKENRCIHIPICEARPINHFCYKTDTRDSTRTIDGRRCKEFESSKTKKKDYSTERRRRTKYVCQVMRNELEQRYWRMPVPRNFTTILYVQCTKAGKVNDWNKAKVYQAHDFNPEEMTLVPMAVPARIDKNNHAAVKVGETVYTIYNRMPGILICEVFNVENGKVALIVREIIAIEKDEEAQEKQANLLNDLMFTANENNVFPDLPSLFQRIDETRAFAAYAGQTHLNSK